MSEFKLQNRKVLIKPIVREGKWLGKSHSGNFMYDNTRMFVTVPRSGETGRLIDPLTSEEREFFEDRELSGLDFSKGDLNPNKAANPKEGFYPFWQSYEYMIHKNQGVVNEGTVLDELDLSNPSDYLAYKVLLANSRTGGVVAPDWASRYNQGTYKIVIVEDSYDMEEKSSRSMKLGEAYKHFNKIMGSQVEMYELLSVYWLENRKAAKPSEDSKPEWLRAEIQRIIDEDIDTFLKLIKTNYEEKLVVHKGMKAGAITRSGEMFINMEGAPVGNSINEVLLYYKDERHQEEKLKLLALIEADK